MWKKFFDRKNHKPRLGGLEILKYIGPGLLVTAGFIDPGNWATNIAAGSEFGYSLLWVVTLSTIMLIILQHNVAHLGIASGLCLSEATTKYTPAWVSRPSLVLAMLASISTSLAVILGASIALKMLLGMPVQAGAIISAIFILILLFTNSYKKIEKWIIAFVSIVGLSFIYELYLIDIEWSSVAINFVKPEIPDHSMVFIMGVLGAVIMPHNLYLHSEVIQSRQWNLQEEKVIRKQLNYEFADTLLSMVIGWAINCAIILLAASTFFKAGIAVGELEQAKSILEPLLGSSSAIIFAIALLFSGVASGITSGMAGGTIFSGIFQEPYDIKDNHSRLGVIISIMMAVIIIMFVADPFMALIYSQMALSIALPFTIFIQIYLTSSKKVMGKYANGVFLKILLFTLAAVVSGLNVYLLVDTIF